jgi:hypothetical protein
MFSWRLSKTRLHFCSQSNEHMNRLPFSSRKGQLPSVLETRSVDCMNRVLILHSALVSPLHIHPSSPKFTNRWNVSLCKIWLWRTASSGIFCRVAFVWNDVSEEYSVFIISVTRICELGTKLAKGNVVPSKQILVTLRMEALSSSESSVHTRTARRNIPEYSIPRNVSLFSCLFYVWT